MFVCDIHSIHVCAGPNNFSNLRSQVPTAMRDLTAVNLPSSTGHVQPENKNPQLLNVRVSEGPEGDSAAVVNRIGERFGVVGDRTRPGSAKRKSESQHLDAEAAAPKRACVHGVTELCNRCTQEKTRSASVPGQQPDAAARDGNTFHDRTALSLSEVIPGLLPLNTENLTQPLQLTQCIDPLPQTDIAPAKLQHLAKAARMRKQKAPPNRTTQVCIFSYITFWECSHRDVVRLFLGVTHWVLCS
jgi:hypothetical protein